MKSEHLGDTSDGIDEGVNFIGRRIESKTYTCGTFNLKSMHEWFCTVVTSADGDAEAVEEGAEVEVVDVVSVFLNEEGNDGIGIATGVSEKSHAVNRAELLDGIAGELLLMLEDVVHAKD